MTIFLDLIYLGNININDGVSGFGFGFCTAIYMQGFQILGFDYLIADVNVDLYVYTNYNNN